MRLLWRGQLPLLQNVGEATHTDLLWGFCFSNFVCQLKLTGNFCYQIVQEPLFAFSILLEAPFECKVHHLRPGVDWLAYMLQNYKCSLLKCSKSFTVICKVFLSCVGIQAKTALGSFAGGGASLLGGTVCGGTENKSNQHFFSHCASMGVVTFCMLLAFVIATKDCAGNPAPQIKGCLLRQYCICVAVRKTFINFFRA